MNAGLYPRRRGPLPCCDACGEPIGAGEEYYELPDGWRICAERDCLADWAAPYRRRRCTEDEEEAE